MSIGGYSNLREMVTTIAEPRITTQAGMTFDPGGLDMAVIAHGSGGQLVSRMTRGHFNDDGTAGGVTARASMGLEE